MKHIHSYISFINEALSFSFDELKTNIKENPDIKIILRKGVKFSDIKDPEKFFKSIKYAVFNNKKVLDYIKKVGFYPFDFDFIRKMKYQDFNEYAFDRLKSTINELVKRSDQVSGSMLSKDTKDAVINWINADRRRYRDNNMLSELDNIPDLKPEGPIKIYRGMLWSKYDFAEDREGTKFIKSIREGTDIVDFTDANPTSWTIQFGIADNFATAKPSSSYFSGTMQWLMAKGKIQGELGAVIMILAKPEDVIADLSKVNNKLNTKFGWENEVILREGTYTAKIVSMYDKDGEIDPKKFSNKEQVPDGAVDAINKLTDTWFPKYEKLRSDLDIPYSTMTRDIFDPQFVSKLLNNSDKIYNIFSEYYQLIKALHFEYDYSLTSTDPAVRKIITLMDSGFKYVKINGSKKTKFNDYDSVDALLNDITEYDIAYGKLESVLSDYLKDKKIIKRDLKNYTKDNILNLQLKAYKDILDSIDYDYKNLSDDDIIKIGKEKVIDAGKISKQIYWMDKA